jgi:hypothetical protein
MNLTQREKILLAFILAKETPRKKEGRQSEQRMPAEELLE